MNRQSTACFSADCTARAQNRRVRLLSALRAHTKAPYKTELLWRTLRALNRPGWSRTVAYGISESSATQCPTGPGVSKGSGGVKTMAKTVGGRRIALLESYGRR
jgi:hypothetical protein